MYYEQRDHHAVAENITPKVTIKMINGGTAKFVFPVFNHEEVETEDGHCGCKLIPVPLDGKTFEVHLSNAPIGFQAYAELDKLNEGEVHNGIRFVATSSIFNEDARKFEWPISVPYNIIDSTSGEAFVYGTFEIEYAPYQRMEVSNG